MDGSARKIARQRLQIWPELRVSVGTCAAFQLNVNIVLFNTCDTVGGHHLDWLESDPACRDAAGLLHVAEPLFKAIPVVVTNDCDHVLAIFGLYGNDKGGRQLAPNAVNLD